MILFYEREPGKYRILMMNEGSKKMNERDAKLRPYRQLPGTEVPGLKGTCNSVHINLPEYSRLVSRMISKRQRSYQWTGGYRSELPNYESNLFT